jgi:hypothetical protein
MPDQSDLIRYLKARQSTQALDHFGMANPYMNLQNANAQATAAPLMGFITTSNTTNPPPNLLQPIPFTGTPSQPSLLPPPPSGNIAAIAFIDAMGQAHYLVVDQAYMALLHAMSYSLPRDGFSSGDDFTIAEMERAETIIEDLR